jgi:hypothetical protein
MRSLSAEINGPILVAIVYTFSISTLSRFPNHLFCKMLVDNILRM